MSKPCITCEHGYKTYSYCSLCEKEVPHKTKAEERLIKEALKVFRAFDAGYTISSDGEQTQPFLRAAKAVSKERKKK